MNEIKSKRCNVYIASCQREGGIYQYVMDEAGRFEEVTFTALDRPMYMVISEKKMYVLLRDPWDKRESGVISYDLDEEGRLRNPSMLISTRGQEACHLLVDQGEVYCVNYSSGSVIKLPDILIQHTGRGQHPVRQDMAHTHFVGLTPEGAYICVADLGTDTIYLYDKSMTLHSKIQGPMGHGVRHLAFSEDGKYLFAANELASTVSVFSYDAGTLKFIQARSALPADFYGESYAAAIRIRGDEIFVSNRGHDSISRMKFENGELTLLETIDCHGMTPRDFQFAGEFLLSANQDSNTVTVLKAYGDFDEVRSLRIGTPLCVCVDDGRSMEAAKGEKE